jgi:hypothetical protein
MKKQCTKDINEFHILEPSCKTLWRSVTEKAEMHRLMLESGGVGVPLHFKCRVIQQKQKENICTVAFIPIDVYTLPHVLPIFVSLQHDSYELLYIWTNDETVRKNLGIRQVYT